jgi:hypothetical protein
MEPTIHTKTTMNSMLKLAVLSLLALAIAGMPAQLTAQTNAKPASAKQPAAEKKEPAKAEKKPMPGPFHGKLAAMDKAARTITVGKRTFFITAETKIRKGGNPATLDDGVVGEQASGYVKPSEDGKLIATTVNFGPKPGSKSAEKTNQGTAKK